LNCGKPDRAMARRYKGWVILEGLGGPHQKRSLVAGQRKKK